MVLVVAHSAHRTDQAFFAALGVNTHKVEDFALVQFALIAFQIVNFRLLDVVRVHHLFHQGLFN